MSGERILIIDDEPTVVRLCIETLADEGYQVHGAGGGQEALARLEEERFDLLLVDLLLTDMDGVTVLQRARELDPHVTAIVITGYGTLETAVDAVRAGARGFLLKPFTPDDLLPAVAEALEARRQEQENLLLRARLPILEISQTLMAEGDVESLAQRLLEVVVRQVGADRAALMLLDEQTDQLQAAGTVGLTDKAGDQARVPVGQGVTRQALLRDEPLVVDGEADPDPPLRAVMDGSDAVVACVPLRTRRGAIGVLVLSRSDGGAPFTPSELNLLSIVSSQIATALENARLFEVVTQSERDWETTFDAMTDWVTLTDLEGRILRTNRAGEEFAGVSLVGIVGQKCCNLVHDSEKPLPGCPLQRMCQTHQREALEFQVPDGSRWLMVTVDPVTDTEGNLVGAVHTVRDITARKQAEEALRDSRHMLQTVLDSIPAAVFWKDRDSIYLGGNRTWLEAAGLESSEEVVGKSDYDLPWERKQADSFREDDRRVMESGIPEYDIIEPYRRVDGTHSWARTNKVPLRDAEGNVVGVLGTYEDITDRKRIEEERARSQRLLLALSQAAQAVQRARTPGEVYQTILDEMGTLGYNATIFAVTDDRAHLMALHMTFEPGLLRAAEKLTGLSARNYLFPLEPGGFYQRVIAEGKTVFSDPGAGPIAEALPRLARPLAGRLEALLGVDKAIYAPLQAGGETHSLLTVMGPDLTEADVPAVTAFANQAAIAIENARLFGAVQNELTARKQAEEALRKERDRAQQYLDIAEVMLVALNTQGEITLINRKGSKILGYEEEALLSQNWFDTCLPAPIRESTKGVFDRLMAGEIEPVEYHENPVLTRAGGERIIAWHNTVLTDEAGNIVGTLSSGEDITGRKRMEEALRESEQKFRSVVEQSSDGIALVDEQGTIIEWNRGQEQIFGLLRAEALGQPIWAVHEQLKASVLELLRTGQVSRLDRLFEREIQRPDGQRRVVQTLVFPIEVDQRVMIGSVSRDITDLKRAEGVMERRAAQLALLNDVGSRIAATLELDDVLDRAAGLVQESFGYHHVALFTVDRQRGELVMRARAGDFAHLFPPDHRLELGQGIVGWVGRHGEALLINDVDAEPRYVNRYPDQVPTRSELSVPIRVAGEIVGVLDIQSPQLDAFDENDVLVMETLSDQIAVALENARLFEVVAQGKREWETSFDAMTDWVTLTDLEGRILRTNRVGEEFVGVPLTRIVGQNCCKLVHGSEKPLPECPLQRMCQTHQRESMEFQLPDGERWLMVAVDPVTGTEGNLVGAVHTVRDITGRKQAEVELRILSSVVEQSASAIAIIDLEGNVEYANPPFLERNDFSPEQIVGQNWRTFLSTSSSLRERYPEIQDTVLQRGALWRGEIIDRTEGGEAIWREASIFPIKDANGVITHSVYASVDITARKRAEEALRESEARYRALVESSSDHIFMLGRDGIYLTSNNRVSQFGLEDGESLAGHHLRDVYPPEVSEFYQQQLKLVLASGQAVDFEHPMTESDGQHYHSDTLYPIHRDGEVWAVGGICRDITARKQAEEEISKLAKFPGENPAPVLRVANDGTILYANKSSLPLLNIWGCQIGQRVPGYWRTFVLDVLNSGSSKETEVDCEDRILSLTFAPVVGADYINIYGLDVTERKQAEEALRASEERYRSLFESVPVGLYRTTPEGQILDANPALIEMLGYPDQETLLETNAIDGYASAEDRRWWLDLMEREGIVHGFETQWVRYAGTTIWVRDSARAIRDDQGQVLYYEGSVADITERKQAEEALRQRNRELALLNRAGQALSATLDLEQVLITVLDEARGLLDVTACSVWLIDPETGELICQQSIGPQVDVVCGWRLKPGEGLAGWVAQHGESLSVPDAQSDERYFRGVDERTGILLRSIISVPLRAREAVIGVLQVVDTETARFGPTDLTLAESLATTAAAAIENARLFAQAQQEIAERRRAEEALRIQRDLAVTLGATGGLTEALNRLLESTFQLEGIDCGGVYLVDRLTGELNLVTHQGLSPDFVKSVSRFAANAPQTRLVMAGQTVHQPYAQVLLGEKDPVRQREGLRAISIVPVHHEGQVIAVLNLASHTHEELPASTRHSIEAIAAPIGMAIENARLAEETAEIEILRELDRLRSELIANVSHELRTPLGLIKIFCTTLLREDAEFDRETQREFLRDIDAETDKLEEIVDNLLDLSRMRDGRMRLERRHTALDELAREVTADMASHLTTQHRFVHDFPAEPLVATVDPKRVEQVLRNILSNAVKYSPAGGTITIQGRREKGQVLIRVSDQGIGIPPEDLERVFERFYRVENEVTQRVRGAGLGLAVCRGIVEAHGGRIWAESALGEGSSFYFTLPVGDRSESV